MNDIGFSLTCKAGIHLVEVDAVAIMISRQKPPEYIQKLLLGF